MVSFLIFPSFLFWWGLFSCLYGIVEYCKVVQNNNKISVVDFVSLWGSWTKAPTPIMRTVELGNLFVTNSLWNGTFGPSRTGFQITETISAWKKMTITCWIFILTKLSCKCKNFLWNVIFHPAWIWWHYYVMTFWVPLWTLKTDSR